MFRNFYYLTIFILFTCITGCASVDVPLLGKWVKQPSSSVKPKLEPVLEAGNIQHAKFVDEGRIANSKLLTKGRDIAFVPFKAGVAAEASQQLDKIALRIVKGISDAFLNDRSGKHAHFNILTIKNTVDADIYVKGYITLMKQSPKFKKWILMKEKKTLGVSGKLLDVKTGETLVIFKDQEESVSRDEGYNELGYRIGINIGQFILSGVEL